MFKNKVNSEIQVIASVDYTELYDRRILKHSRENDHAAANRITAQIWEEIVNYADKEKLNINPNIEFYFKRLCHNFALLADFRDGILKLERSTSNQLYLSLCCGGFSTDLTNVFYQVENDDNYIMYAWYSILADIPVRIMSAETDPPRIIISAFIPHFFKNCP